MLKATELTGEALMEARLTDNLPRTFGTQGPHIWWRRDQHSQLYHVEGVVTLFEAFGSARKQAIWAVEAAKAEDNLQDVAVSILEKLLKETDISEVFDEGEEGHGPETEKREEQDGVEEQREQETP